MEVAEVVEVEEVAEVAEVVEVAEVAGVAKAAIPNLQIDFRGHAGQFGSSLLQILSPRASTFMWAVSNCACCADVMLVTLVLVFSDHSNHSLINF